VGQLADHLRSPQYTDDEGNSTAPARVPMIVAPGRPRWLGYAFCLAAFILGAVLALGILDLGETIGSDLVRIIGIVSMLGAVYGAWEIWRGKPFSNKGLIDRVRGR
jgi:hypothetical protein